MGPSVCTKAAPMMSDICCLCRQMKDDAASSQPRTFQAEGGLMAAEAIALLQEFYASGNPNGEHQARIAFAASLASLRGACMCWRLSGHHLVCSFTSFWSGPHNH